MLKNLALRLRQGHRTLNFPREPPTLPPRFRGRPHLHPSRCETACSACVAACPTAALQVGNEPGDLSLDLGRCLFCNECSEACPSGAIEFSHDYRLAASKRENLVVDGNNEATLAAALDHRLQRLFGRSLRLRQVSAGGCNACEAEVNVLNTILYDLGRFGIQLVASPRHADGFLITGPVTKNMHAALEATYAAVPSPKIVIAVGACAISGGPFAGNPEVHDGAGQVLPLDLLIPGCPPHPFTTLDGLLRLLGRIERDPARRPSAAEQEHRGPRPD